MWSPVNVQAKRSGIWTPVTSSIPLDVERRNRVGRSVPRTPQREPSASPRRSGWTPPMPGHQSGKWCGSAMNNQTSSRAASSSRAAEARGMPWSLVSADPEQVAQPQGEVLDQMAQRRRYHDCDGNRPQPREGEKHERPDAHLPACQARDALRIDEDLADLQTRDERRRHASAVAFQELDQVEVGADGNDQLRALLVRKQ